MKTSKILKWVTGGLEAVLGIPFVGGSIVVSFLWTPLVAMLALHIVTLVFSNKEGEAKHGSVLGIVTSCIAWIPVVGMIMHILTAIFLLLDAAKKDGNENLSA
jgi:predicted branched-subunit amino acid permease